MANLKKIQEGFGVLPIILIVLVVAAIGGVGWTVYQNNKTKPTGASQDNSSNNQQSVDQQPSDSTPDPTVTYLEIKEWGVKLPLSENIKDGYYTFIGSNQGNDGKPNTAWIGLNSLNASGCNIAEAGPKANATPLGSIVRVLPDEKHPVQGKAYTELYPNGATINGYYYAYIVWQNKSCASKEALNAIDSAFINAAKGTVESNATSN